MMKTNLKSPPSFLVITFYIQKRGAVPFRPVGLSSVTYGSKLFSKELSRSVIMIIAAVFCYVGLGGCGWTDVSRFPFDDLPARVDPMLSSRMDGGGTVPMLSRRLDSGTARNTLGNPHIASRYWGIEVFREARSQIGIDLLFYIPMMIWKDDIYRYTLISYDKDQIAEFIATGIHRSASKLRMTPLMYDHLELHLKAGDFTFVSEWYDRHETLMVTPTRRDVYLERARFSPQCTAVIGCETEVCTSALSVDEGPSLPFPFIMVVSKTTMYNTVAALSLAPGKHMLKTWAGLFGHGQTITFSCGKGEILYVVIDVSAKEYSWWRGGDMAIWKIVLLKDMPEFFVDRPLLLYRGQWLVDPEPEINHAPAEGF